MSRLTVAFIMIELERMAAQAAADGESDDGYEREAARYRKRASTLAEIGELISALK